MSHGGSRPGAGRKRGSLTKKTVAIANEAAARGITPLEVMIENMRWWHQEAGFLIKTAEETARQGGAEPAAVLDLLRKIGSARQHAGDAARDAAPYMHPRLASIEHAGKGGAPLQIQIVKFSDGDSAP